MEVLGFVTAALQVVHIGLGVAGWWAWQRWGPRHTELLVRRDPHGGWVGSRVMWIVADVLVVGVAEWREALAVTVAVLDMSAGDQKAVVL